MRPWLAEMRTVVLPRIVGWVGWLVIIIEGKVSNRLGSVFNLESIKQQKKYNKVKNLTIIMNSICACLQ